ncbi:mitochondrial PGP phosphatase-domain-containing protein [Lentinula raphanica]|nr:mitochondrial PGP phosphatase-domain-containing protein [Lentinula raphanica]
MPLNVPGILAPLQFLVNPRIIVPNLSVKDIRHLDFHALKRAGYRGVVFDKDNCLTPPKEDSLVPDIEGAWKECREVFGEGNVIVVSNTAGAHVDAGGIQAESVRYHLGVPVLFHSSFKPAYSCVNQIRSYFRSLPKSIEDDELIVVGDRLFTDIRVISKPDDATHALPTRTTLAVWTTGLWVKEATVMRFCERKLLEGVRKWVIAPAENRAEGKEVDRVSPMKNAGYDEDPLKRAFVREIPPPPPPRKRTILQSIVVFVQALQFRRSG